MTRRLLSLLPALALAAALGACDRITGPGGDGQPEALTQLPRALSAAEQETIVASNDFAFGLLREVAKRPREENIFLSPLSASMALGMTMNGARGETLEGMRTALGFGSRSLDEIDASYRTLLDLLRGVDSSVDIRIANSVWTRQGFALEPSFSDVAERSFDAEVASLDFDAPAALGTINGWVKQNTNGKIETILDAIPRDVVMYLIDAVYFKASWRDRFDARQTLDRPFTTADGSTRTVKMMHRVAPGRFFEAGGVRGVELPYGRDAFVMDVVLPPEGTSPDAFVASLDAKAWAAWMGRLAATDVALDLPRFRAEQDYTLNEPLAALGMGLAFTDRADFSGLSRTGGLMISEVKHKTYVDVNEEGTEAAAATSVGVVPTSAPQVVSFVVDRPFLVAIRERFSGAILFLGVIEAP